MFHLFVPLYLLAVLLFFLDAYFSNALADLSERDADVYAARLVGRARYVEFLRSLMEQVPVRNRGLRARLERRIRYVMEHA
ncbi:hypothetical protein JCM16161A_13690 [Vulcanisaeta sp. JCM 16161]